MTPHEGYSPEHALDNTPEQMDAVAAAFVNRKLKG